MIPIFEELSNYIYVLKTKDPCDNCSTRCYCTEPGCDQKRIFDKKTHGNHKSAIEHALLNIVMCILVIILLAGYIII